MLGPWVEIAAWFKSLLPTFELQNHESVKKHRWLRMPRFNFITLHYIYLITLAIVCSVILYPVGNIAYIDCLFFGSGAATQSGLNTVNINELYLYQQITLYIVCMLCTPIFINTFVVFVRLYWFEKRFQNVVFEAQRYRRTRERTRTVSEAKEDHNVAYEETGVGNRRIVVMHPDNKVIRIAANKRSPAPKRRKESSNSETSSDESNEDVDERSSSSVDHATESEPAKETADGEAAHPTDSNTTETQGGFRRDHITFADEVKTTPKEDSPDRGIPRDDSLDRIPSPVQELDPDRHIAFLEKQRNPEDTEVLYIPGPRDFDKGHRPQELGEVEHRGLTRQNTGNESLFFRRRTSLSQDGSIAGSSRRGSMDNPLKKRIRDKIAFEEGTFGLGKVGKSVMSKVKFPIDHDEPADSKSRTSEEPAESDHGDRPVSLRRRGRARTMQSLRSALSNEREEGNRMPYLSYQATIGRNSAFVNLSEEQRDELGGIEYRALKTLAITLCIYYVGFHLLAVVCLAPWIVESSRFGPVPEKYGISRAWWGIFTPASLFNDLGFTLTPNSMYSFKYAVYPLLFGSWLILIGNTGFPCWLRFVVWLVHKFIPKNSSLWEEFRFLLDHPRRCFTLLFPSAATWWLFWVLVLLNVVDLIFFIVLDLHDSILTRLPTGIRIVDGWFQAASTRTAGFAVVPLSDLHPGIQVSYLIMMYISVFPIAISVRRTNVYEEKSLGIWGNENEEESNNHSAQSYVGAHLRRQLSFDLWYIFLGLFIICIVEGDKLQNTNHYAFTIFSVLFEIVSAYGTVGLSLGYPGTDPSFSAQFHTISKLVIIAMQIRGRHRGLPYALDKAILLPSEEQQRKENEDATRRHRSNSVASTQEPPGLPRSATGRSTWSNQSRQGRWKSLVISGLSAGPSIRRAKSRAPNYED